MKREEITRMRAYQIADASVKAFNENQDIDTESFVKGAEWADEHPNWTSVEGDGNPIDTGWYIFTTGKIVDVGYYLGGNEWRDVHPTHWMPIPKPPKKGE